MFRTVFIGSSYDEKNPLSQVLLEANGINDIVTSALEWKCKPFYRISLETVTQKFSNTTESCFQIFHFAGHAIDKTLQFNRQTAEQDKNFLINVGGFAKIIVANHPIQLVFLNGCSTKKQVEAFKNAGIAAVIYTNTALNDYLGMQFAKKFYNAFIKENNTLGSAFDIANAALELEKQDLESNGKPAIDQNIEAIMKRGVDLFDEQQEEALYVLEASDDFKKMKWSQWPKPNLGEGFGGNTMEIAAQPIKISQTDPQDLQTKEIPDTVVHRCDRSDECDEFHEVLEELANKSTDGPVFFFIHEKSPASPQSLVKRFELFGTSELCEENSEINQSMFVWKDMVLPKRRELKQTGKAISRLYEIYNANLFKCNFDEASSDFKFEECAFGDKVFIIHHNLTNLELESTDEIKLWLEHYLDKFSSKVNTELKARLAIVFSFLYFVEQADFEEMFEELSNDARFQGRVRNLTDMQAVSLQNVGVWKEKVFKDRNYPVPPDEKELFPFAEGEKKPMKEVQEILSQKLFDYNQKIRSQHV